MRVHSCALLLLTIGALACGDDSPTSPSVVQVAGTWNGTATSRAWSGGECVGATLQAGGPLAQPFSLAITQSGSSLTATTTSPATGNCSYAGTAASSSITLNLTSCAISVFPNFPCSNGAVRDLRLVGLSTALNISGNNASGTSTYTYDVFIAGSAARVGTVVIEANATAIR
jgi:hypothetical protein